MGSGFASRLVSDMARLGQRWGTLALLLAAGVIALVGSPIPAYAAGGCATPGRDGVATLSGVINTYYPGSGTAAPPSTRPIRAPGDGVAGDPATGSSSPTRPGLSSPSASPRFGSSTSTVSPLCGSSAPLRAASST